MDKWPITHQCRNVKTENKGGQDTTTPTHFTKSCNSNIDELNEKKRKWSDTVSTESSPSKVSQPNKGQPVQPNSPNMSEFKAMAERLNIYITASLTKSLTDSLQGIIDSSLKTP